jgi:two-component system, NarL family, sensor histidine kinase UhpB
MNGTRMSLLARIFLLEVAIFVVAGLVLAFSPVTVSEQIRVQEAVVLAGALAAILAVSFVLLRRAFRPLHALTGAMGEVEPLSTGRRLPVDAGDGDVARLTAAFNAMLGRLESERRDSVRRSLRAQEDERARVARELHDEVGQSLTALLLQLERLGQTVPVASRPAVDEARETVRGTLDEVRDVARRLRPEALDDLGLPNALAALTQRVAEQGIAVRRTVDLGDGPPLPPETELVVYRVAQEALTNALRHADAGSAELSLTRTGGLLVLVVRDDGRGIGDAEPGAGIQGMRERALLVDGACELRDRPGGGTEVRLEVATARAAAALLPEARS